MNNLLTDYDKIFLDTQGILHKKQVFPINEIKECLQFFSENKQQLLCTQLTTIKKYTGYEEHKPILDLLTHPYILNTCEMVFGLNQFKLEHSFIVETTPTKTNVYNFELHGGTHREWNIHYYHSYPVKNISDKPYIRSGQLTVGVPLTRQSVDTGGMIYMPGSHKTAYHMSGNEFKKILSSNIDKRSIFDLLTVPTVDEGDLLLFPESLIHGSYSSGTSDCSRITLYGAYFPIAFNFNFDDAQRNKFLSVANEFQKKIINPPACSQRNLLNFKFLQ